jgi:hypothetical protein
VGTKRKHVLVSSSAARRERFVLNWNIRDVLWREVVPPSNLSFSSIS